MISPTLITASLNVKYFGGKDTRMLMKTHKIMSCPSLSIFTFFIWCKYLFLFEVGRYSIRDFPTQFAPNPMKVLEAAIKAETQMPELGGQWADCNEC